MYAAAVALLLAFAGGRACAAPRADAASEPGEPVELRSEEPFVDWEDPQGFVPMPSRELDLTAALAQSRDPSIETVDEMTARPSSPGGNQSGRASADRWRDSIRDPAIRTVDEQTYGKVKASEKQWYDRINIRGYTQFRINSVLWNDESQAPPYHPPTARSGHSTSSSSAAAGSSSRAT